MSHRVVVTGVGMVTALGNSAPGTWEAVRAGRSGTGPLTRFPAGDLPPAVCVAAEVKEFSPEPVLDRKEAKRVDLFIQYALVAADEALRGAGLDGLAPVPEPEETGVIVGSGIGGIGTILETAEVARTRGSGRVSPFFIPSVITNLASGQVAMRTGARGPNYATVSACASSNHAIGDAFHIIGRGDARMMIAGGSEAAINSLSFAGYHAARALATEYDSPEAASRPFDARRNGFVHGEGAGILVLESLESARERGAPILAEIIGIGMSSDAHHITAPPEDGAGAALAMRRALRSAGIEPERVDYVNAHGTSTPVGDVAEARAIRSVFGAHAGRLPVSSTKSMLGHSLGATAAVEAALTIFALREGVLPPTINLTDPDPECDLDFVPLHARRAPIEIALSNSFGFGGANSALVLKRWDGD
ncbi:MAG TPA: beta-ketoacyl-ACP synthase II [Longimicrobiaceae bacterium]|nr:beta-ketoacyl-ACP synthase II [Longimicrobiaceae bacterium]